MQLKYGAYAFLANSAFVTMTSESIMSQGMTPLGVRVKIQVKGYLEGTSQTDLISKELGLISAMKVPYQTLAFFADNNSPTAMSLSSSNSISGVIIDKQPSFGSVVGAEYVNQRTFEFSGYADTALPTAKRSLQRFSETLSFSGGGSLKTYFLAVSGPHQLQTIYKSLPYEATQSGSSVGYLSRPTAPDPIWPNLLMKAPETLVTSPERMGRANINWGISWKYQFKSLTPLIAVPNEWSDNSG